MSPPNRSRKNRRVFRIASGWPPQHASGRPNGPEAKAWAMILVDTGPWVALFDPKDEHHSRCKKTLGGIKELLSTTVSVLTEAFHILGPQSVGSRRLRDFIAHRGASVWDFDRGSLLRAFELMETFADRPMDLTDASLIVAAEELKTCKVFTVDHGDFQTYRVRRGHRHLPVRIIE
jgi:uncharacterized protein